jgi:hypothetical protein
VLERAPVTAADLEDPSAQAREQPAPQLARDRVGPPPLLLLQVPREA